MRFLDLVDSWDRWRGYADDTAEWLETLRHIDKADPDYERIRTQVAMLTHGIGLKYQTAVNDLLQKVATVRRLGIHA